MPTNLIKNPVFTGARARLSINQQVVGYATGCNGSEMIDYERIVVLDSILPIEYVPIGYDITFSASRVRLIGQSFRGPDLAIFPLLGKTADDFLQNILNMGDLTIQIDDTKTDKDRPGGSQTFMILEQAKLTRHSWAINARGVVMVDAEFLGVKMRDENDL